METEQEGTRRKLSGLTKFGMEKRAVGPGKTMRIICVPGKDPTKEIPAVPSSVT